MHITVNFSGLLYSTKYYSTQYHSILQNITVQNSTVQFSTVHLKIYFILPIDFKYHININTQRVIKRSKYYSQPTLRMVDRRLLCRFNKQERNRRHFPQKQILHFVSCILYGEFAWSTRLLLRVISPLLYSPVRL